MAGFAEAVENCKARINPATGVVEMSAKKVGASPLWGWAAGAEAAPFFNETDCASGTPPNMKLRNCLIGDPTRLAARNPPEGCMLFVADGSGRCATLIKGCVPGQRIAVACFDAAGCDAALIQAAINALPPESGSVLVGPGTYNVRTPIVIDRDNVTLRGAGSATVLRLDDGRNCPVLILGQDTDVVTASHSNLHVLDLMVDGNRAHQTVETKPGTQLRNNGISMRRVESSSVERVAIVGAISGGLVCERGCRQLVIRDLESSGNAVDGLACYETEHSIFSGLRLHDNGAAGLSFDSFTSGSGFNENVVSDVVVRNSGKVGFFMRFSRDNVIHGLTIRDSAESGIFLAQRPPSEPPTEPARGNTFSACHVSRSADFGIYLADPTCTDNLVIGCQFVENDDGCIGDPHGVLPAQSAYICR